MALFSFKIFMLRDQIFHSLPPQPLIPPHSQPWKLGVLVGIYALPALMSNLLQRRGRAGRGRKRKSKRTSWVLPVEQSIRM